MPVMSAASRPSPSPLATCTTQPRREFYAKMDAANVDLKAFTEAFYFKLTGSHLQPVLDTLVYLKHETDVWFEITTLLIPTKNDSDEEITAMCKWIAAALGTDVPLHFTAFHPDWKLDDLPPTPATTLTRAREIALREGLQYVYTGNVHDIEGGTTFCSGLRGRTDRPRLAPDPEIPHDRRRPLPVLRAPRQWSLRAVSRAVRTPANSSASERGTLSDRQHSPSSQVSCRSGRPCLDAAVKPLRLGTTGRVRVCVNPSSQGRDDFLVFDLGKVPVELSHRLEMLGRLEAHQLVAVVCNLGRGIGRCNRHRADQAGGLLSA